MRPRTLTDEERLEHRKNSARKYNSQIAKIDLRVPAERKELYKTAAGEMSLNAYIVGLIEADLKKRRIK